MLLAQKATSKPVLSGGFSMNRTIALSIIAHVEDRLPAIAEATGVDVIVSKGVNGLLLGKAARSFDVSG